MSKSLYISIEGFEAQDWKSTFESKVMELIPDENLEIFVPRILGGAGGGKKNKVGVRNNTRAVNMNTSASILASILLAASLAIPDIEPNAEVECMINGDKGSVAITVSGGHDTLTETIQSCIEKIGDPEELKITPKNKTLKIIKI